MAKKISKGKFDLGTKEYEDAIKFPLTIIKIMCSVYALVAIVVPIFKGSGLFMDSFISFICMLLVVGGGISCHGRLFDFTSMIPVTGIRALQFVYYLFYQRDAMNFITFTIIVLLEIIINVYCLVDKSIYSYVKEEENLDEFY